MTYNAKIIHEQGGSVLRIASGGSLIVDAGGTIAPTGTVAVTDQTVSGSLTVNGAAFLGTVQLLFGAITSPPVVGAVPGSIYLRSDGSVSNMYVNVSTGAAGSVWTATCVNAP